MTNAVTIAVIARRRRTFAVRADVFI